MKKYTLTPIKVLSFLLFISILFSCSKDSDLLTDLVLRDTLIPIEGPENNSEAQEEIQVTINLENGTVETNEDVIAVLNITDLTSSASGKTTTLKDIIQPINGQVTVEKDSIVKYHPNADFNGSDSFNFTIEETDKNNTVIVNEVTLDVLVMPIPDTVNDTLYVEVITEMGINVLNNDTFNDIEKVSISNISTPANGTVSLNEDMSIIYSPLTIAEGDNFTYTTQLQHEDGTVTSEEANVVIISETNPNEGNVPNTNTSPFPFCQTDPNPIAGGAGYENILSSSDATIHITSFTTIANFKNTIENAAPNSIIFIDGNLTIDLTGLYSSTGDYSITVPSGVTIASDRGITDGALIKTDDFAFRGEGGPLWRPLFQTGGDNIRFTGLRLQGPFQERGSLDRDYAKMKFGISILNHHNLEVDNNELYGWPFAAVAIGYPTGSTIKSTGNLVHHNYIHNNVQNSIGYGIQVSNGFVHIYANEFYYQRHDIAGTGHINAGYEASCNLVRQGGTSHNFDMHGDKGDSETYAGDYIYIHHNDFQDIGGENRYYNNNDHNIKYRGRPIQESIIENNRFAHPSWAESFRQYSPADPYGTEGYGNVVNRNNTFNGD